MPEKFITLLTDFGEKDWFVGAMKGVMASISPQARAIDITHLIPSGDIRRGAFALRCAYRYFPQGTVHLAVVDPGVGSNRDILVVRGGGYVFVAPDNGLLSYILADLEEKTTYHVTRKDLFLDEVSDTFHGRDIFAPLAAHLSAGFPVEQVGPEVSSPVIFSLPVARPVMDNCWEAEIITADRFGNCITSLSLEKMEDDSAGTWATGIRVTIHDEEMCLPLVKNYSAVGNGSPLAIWGSSGFLELAVNGGDAGRKLNLKAGDKVKMQLE